MCAGWDGNSHPAFLWKRIKGRGYCKDCTYKLEIPKALNRTNINNISEKQKEKNVEKRKNTEILHNWFNILWEKLPKNKLCSICNTPIFGSNLSIYWDHLLEKNKYPELALNEDNILFVCGTCHTLKTNGNPLPKHKELIEEAKRKLL